MSKLAKALTAAAGNAGEALYVEDVFSTYLYTSTGSEVTVTNGIDLAGEGGFVWTKSRSVAGSNFVFDTENGAGYYLITNSTAALQGPLSSPAFTFQSDGFTSNAAGSGNTYASWTFRKAEKFFDVVTFSTSGAGGTQSVNHNLGVTPAFIIIKKTSAAQTWLVYHSSVTSPNSDWWKNFTALDDGVQFFDWGDNSGIASAPTDSSVTLGSYFTNPTADYVMYLFASDAGGFGDDGSESIIKCGSYTADASNNYHVDVGFEPQWVMIKKTSGTGDWEMLDVMRGFTADASAGQFLEANNSNAEFNDYGAYLTSTGFVGSNQSGANGATYIYIAIRRPMKTPESGTEVFATAQRDTTAPIFEGGFPVDAAIIADVSGAWTNSPSMGSRLTGTSRLATSNTNAQGADGLFMWDYMNGWGDGSGSYPEYYSWMFKRATGFFDVVAYTGDATIGATQAHNLGVAPDMMIVKNRSSTDSWAVYHKDAGTGYLFLNATDAYRALPFAWNNTNPSASTFTLHSNSMVNGSGFNYIAYLFATVAGVSKVGSYTGTAADLNVDCGFSAGARFVMIKRTDSTGDWYVWDSVRGIVAGNDPYLLLNSSAAEVTNTDYIDPLASGFTVTSSAPAALNASGGNYIFLAIA